MWRYLLSLLTVIGAAGLLLIILFQMQLPSVDSLKDVQMAVPLRVYSADGLLIAEYGEERRIPVKLDDVPEQLVDAVLATEDRRFFEHPGVDLRGLLRASVALLMSGGDKTQGGSTITMQVARNFFLTREKSYMRKINEILLAFKIERELSKEEILTLYLNKVFFGKRAYGVAAAAEVYYGKKLNELTLAQMAMIAGLPKAPSSINPINDPAEAAARRKHVLENMLEYGFITEEEFNGAIKAPVATQYHGATIAVSAPYVGEMVRLELLNYLGDKIYSSGYKIYTTVDSRLQQAANNALQNGILAYDQRHGYRGPEQQWNPIDASDKSALQRWQKNLQKISDIHDLQPAAVLQVNNDSVTALLKDGEIITIPWKGLSWAKKDLGNLRVSYDPKKPSDILQPGAVIRVRQVENAWRLYQIPKIEGSLVAINPQNGAILSLVGGFNFEQSKFNRATQAERQPGSAFKPFIYSAALANGYTAATIVNDAPIVVNDWSGWWRPQNHTRQFNGPTRLRLGLAQSRNLVSIRLLQMVGIEKTINQLTQFGFPRKNLPESLSLALGTLVTTPLELTNAYAVFANGGYYVTPHFVRTIVDNNNEVIYTANSPVACTECSNDTVITRGENTAPQVITADNAFIMTSILSDVIRKGTAKKAMALNRNDLAGKTGTTNDQRDAWFSGYNMDMVATAWIGFDNYDSTGEYGTNGALPIWIDFMRVALQGKPQHPLPKPANIITASIDPTTGLLARKGQANAIGEFFAPGTVPTQTASIAGDNPYAIQGEGKQIESLF